MKTRDDTASNAAPRDDACCGATLAPLVVRLVDQGPDDASKGCERRRNCPQAASIASPLR